jgi:hypothetical protein
MLYRYLLTCFDEGMKIGMIMRHNERKSNGRNHISMDEMAVT